MREIYYRILTGEQGGSMRAALSRRGHFGKMTRAIRKIHSYYHEHLDVETLAQEAGMSVPNFHLHFRNVTGASPMQYLKSNVKVIHIAERDTQRSSRIKSDDEFVNTWSVEGFVSEAGQPAELGWGSHEKTWPPFARHHQFGSNNAIYLERPGASVPVKTWTPNGGPCTGLLITHNEAISLPDFLTVKDGSVLLYRPTVHYAYHPCDDALLSVHEYVGRGWKLQDSKRIMNDEIAPGGVDALGVLLMGHALNAYWYGSILSIDEARQIAPFNTATSLQVAAGVYSGIIWAIENPDRGIVEPEQMDLRGRDADFTLLDLQAQVRGVVLQRPSIDLTCIVVTGAVH